MAWIAVATESDGWFSRSGAGGAQDGPPALDSHHDAMLTRGSLVIETQMPVLRRPRPLFYYRQGGVWPLQICLQALPGGGLAMIVDHGGNILHQGFDCADAGRTDRLRLTYAWDAPRRIGLLALERPEGGNTTLIPITAPQPLRARDIEAMTHPGSERYMAPEVQFLAVSSEIEPVGPNPSLLPGTPILTPEGFRPAGGLRRGDLVTTPQGHSVPVLHAVDRVVPALGGFAPQHLRAPYFGLRQDITVAPSQKLVLSGSEVEYLFGREAVLIQAGHLSGHGAVTPAPSGPFVRYVQLLLPENDLLNAAGGHAESLFIGRLRRKPEDLAASLLGRLDRQSLPEHAARGYPVLRAFDAIVLAEHRAA